MQRKTLAVFKAKPLISPAPVKTIKPQVSSTQVKQALSIEKDPQCSNMQTDNVSRVEKLNPVVVTPELKRGPSQSPENSIYQQLTPTSEVQTVVSPHTAPQVPSLVTAKIAGEAVRREKKQKTTQPSRVKEDEKKPVCKDVVRKPRPAASALSLFTQEKKAALKGTLGEGENLKQKITEAWENLSPQERDLYQGKAEADCQRYEAELKEFYLNNPELNKPKKPIIGYMLFIQGKRSELLAQGLSMCEVSTKAGELWKQLSEAEQQVYKDAKPEEMAEFTRQHAEWREACKEAKKRRRQEEKEEVAEKKQAERGAKKPSTAKLMSALQLYAADHAAEAREAGVDKKELLKWATERWDAAPPEVVERYTAKAKELRARLEEENPALALPKKPASHYAIYVGEQIPLLKQEHPAATFRELQDMAVKQWGQFDAEQQQVYRTRAEAAKEQHKAAMAEFTARFPDWQPPPRNAGAQASRSSSPPPKRAKNTEDDALFVSSSAFLWFAHEKREELALRGCEGRQAAVEVARLWQELPPEAKEPFTQLVKRGLAVFTEARKLSSLAQEGSRAESDDGDSKASE